MVFNFRKYNLKKYNTWKYILKPTRTPLEKDIAGVRFTATKKGPRCSASWYAVTPVDLNEGTAMDASMIFAKKPSAELEELMDAEGADMKGQVFSRANKEFCYMFVKSKMVDEKGYEHVADATILFYV